MAPRVSVLLPCRDAAAYLEPCLESLFAQTLGDLEIVAVDDGSRDGTAERLEGLARLDGRLRVLRRPRRGLVAALRAAAAAARAPLLARMDADDLSRPERLERQVAFLDARPDVAVVGTRVRLFPRQGLTDGLRRYERWLNGLLTPEAIRRDLFVESPLPHPSVLVRREAYEAVGGYRDAGWPEDYDLWMRMALAGYRLAKVPEVLLDWRDRADRASRTDPRYRLDRFDALKEHYLLASHLAGRTEIAIWGAGPTGKAWARRLGRRGIRVRHFVELDPRKLGKRIHGAEVVAPDALARLEGRFLLVAVAAPARRAAGAPRPAREEIRAILRARGWRELDAFVCVA